MWWIWVGCRLSPKVGGKDPLNIDSPIVGRLEPIVKSSTYSVFVDHKTASSLGITEAEGRPDALKDRDGVYVGETPPVTTYESWEEIPEAERSSILVNANRQIIQDAKNALRADVKGGGTLTLASQLKAEMAKLNDPAVLTDLTKMQTIGKEIARLNREIADAKLARKTSKATDDGE